MGEYKHIVHEFEPVFDGRSRLLILGSLPSVKSREQGFYYGHPRNRFWAVISKITGSPLPETIEQKKQMLLQNSIAIWDVIAECDIIGSADASIKNAVPADIMRVLNACDIAAIYANGSTAARLYQKHMQSITGREIMTLPSTSPANAAWSLERLAERWGEELLPLLGR
jgi:hypoxanthine-DNA glycosylase